MPKNTKEPYNFDDCHICTVSRRAESKGVSLSEKELLEAFAVQAEQSKLAPVPQTKSTVMQRKNNE